jgi:sugar phosphate isomerase/epimerase
MNRIISINTLIYQGYDLPTALREISHLDAKYVEMAFIKTYSPDLKEEDFSERNGQRLRGMLADFGLSTLALSAHMDLGRDDSVDPFKRRMTFAKGIGARIIITNVSHRSHEDSFFKNMERLAQFAQSIQLIIALENPGDGEDHIVDSGKTGALSVRKIGSDSVRLNYDIGNTFINSKGGLRPEDDFEEAIPWAVHFHLKDVRQDEEGYFYSEIGKGVIDYRMILQSLSKKAPSVPMGIELPLCLKRGRDFIPWIDPTPVELREIRRVLKGSLDFIKCALGTQGGNKKEES